MKGRRLTAIRQIVEQEPVHSQEELRKRLLTMGFDVTQATLSRDIKELGLMKRSADGAYQAAGAGAAAPSSAAAAAVALSRALGEFLLSVDVAQQLVVLKTGPGQAQLLAIAVDRAQLPDVLGTIAGDDTILVICRDARAGQATRATIAHLTSEA
jgi:transcriptional regulator of arginine metabolism